VNAFSAATALPTVSASSAQAKMVDLSTGPQLVQLTSIRLTCPNGDAGQPKSERFRIIGRLIANSIDGSVENFFSLLMIGCEAWLVSCLVVAAYPGGS